MPTILGIWALLLLGSVGLARRVPALAPNESPPLTRAQRWVVAGSAAILVCICGLFLARAVYWLGYFHIDLWDFWIPKAKTIYYFGGLDTKPGGFTSQISPNYPPLKPGLDAVVFAFAGKADPLLIPVQNAFVDVAFLAAVAAVVARVAGLAVALPAALLLAALPRMTYFVGSSLADELLAVLFTLTVLLIACWLLNREPRFLVLAALFMTAATLTKNDGVMLSLVAVTAGIAAAGRQRRLVALAAVPAAVAFVAWKAWTLANHVSQTNDYYLSYLARPHYLANHLGELAHGASQLLRQAASPSAWLLVVPLTVVASVLVERRQPALARFALGVPVASLAAYAVIYWVSVNRVSSFEAHYAFIDNSAWRLVAPICVSSAALLPLLLWQLGRREIPVERATNAS